ncbi:alpha/beta fold hydrolase [Pseudonocardia alni]|uniref:Pimeloyl-ACP methyl ester carboxylesterase n=1 Tax=Pseudonocardia alni TaxID=33907 RepID=A0AA44ULY3_PSEA5|nr:alpha/beta hydrolase [Pseudonocardia alni]PKB29671.1 pimeloyl-ACP methyl ester carboxylesterase [Pseudonocardia alni]
MRLPARICPPEVLPLPDSARFGQVGAVAVPGLGLSVRGWEPTLSCLGLPFPATALALPAYGVPASPRAPLDPRSSARRLLRRMDDLGIGSAVLLGHSASCQVVAEVARSAPGRVPALVLVGPTADPRAGSWAALVRGWLRNVVAERPGQVPQLVRDYTYSGMVSFVRALEATRRHPLSDAVGGFGGPVLLLRGVRDGICSADWLARLAASAAAAEVADVASAAHMAPLTHGAEMAAALRPFLASAGSGRPRPEPQPARPA